MGRPKTLTARDRELLTILSRCRVLEIDHAKIIYGVQDYHRYRVRVLKERGYVLQKGRYVEIAQKGLREVNPDEKVTPVRRKGQREKLAAVAEIYFALRDAWDFEFSQEYKRRTGAFVYGRFGAIISKNNKQYALYLLTTDPRESTVKAVRQEISGLRRYGITRAVVLYGSEDAARSFGDDHCGLDSLLLLPYPDGLKILKHQDDIYNLIGSKYPQAVPCGRPFADFEWGNVYITVLVDNDLAKHKYLRDYLEHIQEKENRACVGVCLPGQKEALAETFPQLKLVVMPESYIPDSSSQEQEKVKNRDARSCNQYQEQTAYTLPHG